MNKKAILAILIALTCGGIANIGLRAGQPDPHRSVVKIVTTSIRPDYSNPWKMLAPTASSGSGAIIKGNLILTNAHVVSDATYIQVQKENDPDQYQASLAFISHECDLALIRVGDQKFFEGTGHLEFGGMPALRSTVATFGYPAGGESISITEGIVSRIETGTYSHSGKQSLLMIQTDAALNPGNSGGPAVQDGLIIGVAFQVQAGSDNIGYLIPVPVIDHFFRDISDGLIDGIPSLGIFTQPLQSRHYREYLGMDGRDTGVMVSHVVPGGSADGYITEGDVITAIEGAPVANDGTIATGIGRLFFMTAVDFKQMGDRVGIEIFRKGKKEKLSVPLRPFPERVKWYNEYETMPEYYIFGGIIFQPLSREYLKTWEKWWINADRAMLYHYAHHISDRIRPERKEFVIINRVLPDSANTYISDVRDMIVSEINGMRITCMKDVPKAFMSPRGKFHVISIDGTNVRLLLRVDEMEEANLRLQQAYDIPSMQMIYSREGER